MKSNKAFLFAFVLSVVLPGCSIFHQPGNELSPIYTKILRTDYNTAWQAALDSLKDFNRTVVNREAGVIQTAWIENTAQKNFTDSFGHSETFLKAKYRLSLSIAPGVYNGKPSVKVSVQKEQYVQRDMLEGWTYVKSDTIEEHTILYRVTRVVFVKHKLRRMEEEKARKLLGS